MDSVWAFIIFVMILVFLAGMLAYVVQERDEAIKANQVLRKDVAELRRYLDRRNHQVCNLVVENYEQNMLLRQAYDGGYIPQPMKHGREN